MNHRLVVALSIAVLGTACTDGKIYASRYYVPCQASRVAWQRVNLQVPVTDGGVASVCIDAKACTTNQDCVPWVSAVNRYVCVRGTVSAGDFVVDAAGAEGRCMADCSFGTAGAPCEEPFGSVCADVGSVAQPTLVCVPP